MRGWSGEWATAPDSLCAGNHAGTGSLIPGMGERRGANIVGGWPNSGDERNRDYCLMGKESRVDA